MLQLPRMLGPAVHRGKDTTYNNNNNNNKVFIHQKIRSISDWLYPSLRSAGLSRPCVMRVRDPNMEGVIQTDPTLFATLHLSRNKRLLGAVCSKVWPVSNLAQQHVTAGA